MYDKIVEFEELADKIHNNIDRVYIVDTLKHFDIRKWEDLTILERQELTNFVYNAWLKDEAHIDIGCMCDTAMELRSKILSNKLKQSDFLEEIAVRWLC